MELESQLERTIVAGAEQRLREMQAAAPEAEKYPEDFEGPWRGTWPLVELAHVAESGLSNAAIQRLLAVIYISPLIVVDRLSGLSRTSDASSHTLNG